MTANLRVEAILHSRATLHNRATLISNSTHLMEGSNLLPTLVHQVCLLLHTRQRANWTLTWFAKVSLVQKVKGPPEAINHFCFWLYFPLNQGYVILKLFQDFKFIRFKKPGLWLILHTVQSNPIHNYSFKLKYIFSLKTFRGPNVPSARNHSNRSKPSTPVVIQTVARTVSKE